MGTGCGEKGALGKPAPSENCTCPYNSSGQPCELRSVAIADMIPSLQIWAVAQVIGDLLHWATKIRDHIGSHSLTELRGVSDPHPLGLRCPELSRLWTELGSVPVLRQGRGAVQEVQGAWCPSSQTQEVSAACRGHI